MIYGSSKLLNTNCLKLGVMLSLQKDKVWTDDYELGAAPYEISNDLSHTLRGANAQTHTWSDAIRLLIIIFFAEPYIDFTQTFYENDIRTYIDKMYIWTTRIKL